MPLIPDLCLIPGRDEVESKVAMTVDSPQVQALIQRKDKSMTECPDGVLGAGDCDDEGSSTSN